MAVNELPQGGGLLPDGEVLPLEVLHQGQQGGGVAVRLHGEAGHPEEARQLGGAEAALPRDELPAPGGAPDGQGLEHPHLGDGQGQLSQLPGREVPPGLAGVGADFGHRQIQYLPLGCFCEEGHKNASLLLYRWLYDTTGREAKSIEGKRGRARRGAGHGARPARFT